MNVIRPITGVIPVVQTPLQIDGSVDLEAQARLIKFLDARSIGGFWCLGTGSEDMNLTFSSRKLVAEVMCEANSGKLPLVLGCGFYCLQDTFNFIEETQGLNFDAYHFMPYHPLLSLDRLAWIYRKIADFSKKPLFMYTSANWAQPINSDFVFSMMDHQNICGIKFSSSNTVEQLKVLAVQDANFQVITAVANQFFAALSMGSKAGTTSLAGALPEPLIEIYETFVGGNLDLARKSKLSYRNSLALLPKSSKRDNFLTVGGKIHLKFARYM